VDYNQEQFFRMQMDVPKMPFYMSYPMQNLYLTEMEYEKDMERMKELYPKEVKTILSYVEDECDKMEYEGSLMFDEYPDRLMLEQVAERIYNYPEVNSVYLISGGFDFMVTIEGKTLREVSQFVSDKLSPLDSVLSTKTNFILKKYKDHGTVMAEQPKDERIEM